MRLFLSPDNLGPGAYQLLPAAIMLGAHVVVWRPSLHIINRMHNAGKIFYDERDFLSLVESNKIAVSARREWMEGQTERITNPLWNTEPWIAGLDDQFQKIALEDESLETLMRRVVRAPTARGLRWARRTAQKHPQYLKEAIGLFQNKALPAGYFRRLSHASNDEERGFLLLADTRNFANALLDLECDAPIEPAQYSADLALISKRGRQRAQSDTDLPTVRQLTEVMLMLKSLQNFQSFEQFAEFISGDDYKLLVNGLAPLLRSPDAVAHLQKELIDTKFDLNWKDALKTDEWNAGLALIGALMSLAGGVSIHPLFLLGMAVTLLGVPKKLGQKLGVQSLDDTSSIEWLSVLVHHRKSIKIKELGRLRERVLALPKSDLKSLLK